MYSQQAGRDVAERIALLLGLSLLGALTLTAQIEVRGSRLIAGESQVNLHGVVYSPTPIGRAAGPVLEGAGCFYGRDFPLIAATGANAIRTLALVDPADRAFRAALADSDLYWLAGFPLEPYFDPASDLDPASSGGAELRERILRDFVEHVRSWAGEPRLAAILFGDQVGRRYSAKFAGARRHYYSLLAEAAARVRDAELGVAVGAAVHAPSEIGAAELGSTDAMQPDLALWTVDASGVSLIGSLPEQARARTAKALLLGGFGVDAYDQQRRSANVRQQGDLAAVLAAELAAIERSAATALSGAFWNGYSDEWWRGGDPNQHGPGGEERTLAPDAHWNPAWAGLFGVVRTGSPGLDSLRARPAYFALAQAWGGEPPAELSLVGSPSLARDRILNGASGFPTAARGGLLSVEGAALSATSLDARSVAPLPPRLGAASLCVDGHPAPLYHVDSERMRAQAPWEAADGPAEVVAYRAGVASNPGTVEIRRLAPGLLPGGVFRPGLPCPVDEFNGVPAGSVLEVYGSGLGEGVAALETGAAAAAPMQTAVTPGARLNGRQLEVLYSGLFPGAAGVYQTNVRLPDDLPAGVAELRLESGGFFSNPHRLMIPSDVQRPVFGLGQIQPSTLLLQEGGAPQTALVEVIGNHGFCDVVRFLVRGLPSGVHATIPVGLPGEFLPIRVWADLGAARADVAPVTIEGVSMVPAVENVRRFFVSVLPATGDIALRVVSGGWLSGNPVARFEIEGRSVFETFGGGPGRGFNFMSLDAQTGVAGPVRSFDTFGDQEAAAAMERYLLGLPAGDVVLGAIADDGSQLLTENTRRILTETLGSELIDELRYQSSWAIIARVGGGRPMAESLQTESVVVLERILSFPLE